MIDCQNCQTKTHRQDRSWPKNIYGPSVPTPPGLGPPTYQTSYLDPLAEFSDRLSVHSPCGLSPPLAWIQ